MTPSEAALLLTAASTVDNRNVTELAAKEWALALSDLNYPDCLEALRMFRRRPTANYLEPHHIREHVRVIVGARRERDALRRGLPSARPATDEQRKAALELFKRNKGATA